VTDIDDMYRRLAAVNIELEELGLTHERNRQVLLAEAGPNERDWSSRNARVTRRTGQGNIAAVNNDRRPMLSPLTGLVDAAHADS
jgi:hypothetical protein